MSTPLISDATLAKIMRLANTFAAPHEDRWRLIAAVTSDRLAEALDAVRADDPENANLIEALEEANEEAARTHDGQNPLENERDFISRAADALNASFDAGVDAGLDGRTAAMGAIEQLAARHGMSKVRAAVDGPPTGKVRGTHTTEIEFEPGKLKEPMRAWLTFPGGARRLIELGPNGTVRTIEDVPAPVLDHPRGKVTLTAKHSIPYCAGCERADGVADHTCEAAERARAMVRPSATARALGAVFPKLSGVASPERLKAAIRAYTADAKNEAGEDVANGPAEEASEFLAANIHNAAWWLQQLGKPIPADRLLLAAATNAEREADRIRELREAADTFFGEDFRSVK